MSAYSGTDVTKRMAALGLGSSSPSSSSSQGARPTALGRAPPVVSSHRPLSSASSSSSSSGLALLYSRGIGQNSNGKAPAAASPRVPDSGRPPVAPAQSRGADADDDAERRTAFSPPTAAQLMASSSALLLRPQQSQHDDDDASRGLALSPPVSASPNPNMRGSGGGAAVAAASFPSAAAAVVANYDDNDGISPVPDRSSTAAVRRDAQQGEATQSAMHHHHSPPSACVNWPALVELLSQVVEKLNKQLSLVDGAISVVAGSGAAVSGSFAFFPVLSVGANTSEDESNSAARRRLFDEHVQQQKSWASRLTEEARETLELVDYHLRHSSSFGLGALEKRLASLQQQQNTVATTQDVRSVGGGVDGAVAAAIEAVQRLARQLERLRSDLDAVSREAADLPSVLRDDTAARAAREQQQKKGKSSAASLASSSAADPRASIEATLAAVDAENAARAPTPLEVWTNGYLQRLSVAHDLTHRVLFESARYISTAFSVDDDHEDDAINSNNQVRRLLSAAGGNISLADRQSPSPLRRDGSAPLDLAFQHHPAQLLSSTLLLTSCEHYARCCMLEYEKRMRDRLELYARAHFVELNVIVPMTSQVAGLQLSLDERETHLRLAAQRASSAEQGLQAARATFEQEIRRFHRDNVELRRQNEQLTAQIMALTGASSAQAAAAAVSTAAPNRQQQQNQPQPEKSSSATSGGVSSVRGARAARSPLRSSAALPPPPKSTSVSAHTDPRSIHDRARAAAAEEELHAADRILLLGAEADGADGGGGMAQHSGAGADEDESSALLRFTPRTKKYFSHYGNEGDATGVAAATAASASSAGNNNGSGCSPLPVGAVTPRTAEQLMERVTLQLADEFEQERTRPIGERLREAEERRSGAGALPTAAATASSVTSPAGGCETLRMRESPLQKLARMSSPAPSASPYSARNRKLAAVAAVAAEQQQQHHGATASAAAPAPADRRLNMSSSSSSYVSAPRRADVASTTAGNGEDGVLTEEQRHKDRALNQQLKSARSTFHNIMQKYQPRSTDDGTDTSALVPPPRGAHLDLSSSTAALPSALRRAVSSSGGGGGGVAAPQETLLRESESTRRKRDGARAASSSASPMRNNNNSTAASAASMKRAHFADQQQQQAHGDPRDSSFHLQPMQGRVVALERVVLEQRSELSTLKAHLKGIDMQDAEVQRKRDTVAKSLLQQQQQHVIQSASEEELRAVNDRLSLVWAKIEEATERLRKNRQEVLGKMELLQRTLRISERDLNKARMDLARDLGDAHSSPSRRSTH